MHAFSLLNSSPSVVQTYESVMRNGSIRYRMTCNGNILDDGRMNATLPNIRDLERRMGHHFVFPTPRFDLPQRATCVLRTSVSDLVVAGNVMILPSGFHGFCISLDVVHPLPSTAWAEVHVHPCGDIRNDRMGSCHAAYEFGTVRFLGGHCQSRIIVNNMDISDLFGMNLVIHLPRGHESLCGLIGRGC